ncbi:hypothetical protein MHH81_10885 [Psychrobacillus sp. FSL H8-0484]|uniref:hypothetical protein n=1 Tax=Psychrobacillus sp. FSL H8-0484 TaxID=2921390 RepID=UPI0030F61491
MKKIFFVLFLTYLWFSTSIFVYFPITANAALPSGPYTIKDIVAHDSNQHPSTLAELKTYLYSGGKIPGRTGWSAYELTCKPKSYGTGNY